MKLHLLAFAGMAIAFNCRAAAIESFELSENEATLLIHMSDGSMLPAPYTSAEQEGFSNVQISPDRRYIGWTATFGNCCTSYPLPRSLVVHDGSRVVRIAGPENLSIFSWHFSPNSQSFVFQRELPHGNSPHFFRWLRISDGKLLGEFDCDVIDPENQPGRYSHPPKWTGAVDLECRAQPDG